MPGWPESWRREWRTVVVLAVGYSSRVVFWSRFLVEAVASPTRDTAVASKRQRVITARSDRDEVALHAVGRRLALSIVTPARDTAVTSKRQRVKVTRHPRRSQRSRLARRREDLYGRYNNGGRYYRCMNGQPPWALDWGYTPERQDWPLVPGSRGRVKVV